MMGRILNRHQLVFAFNELHFFEQLWSPKVAPESISFEEATQLMARLLVIQRNGYFTPTDPRNYFQEAEEIMSTVLSPITPASVFLGFLCYETKRHGKIIACDQTPRNLYYLNDSTAKT